LAYYPENITWDEVETEKAWLIARMLMKNDSDEAHHPVGMEQKLKLPEQ
jgi:hypothetical protein